MHGLNAGPWNRAGNKEPPDDHAIGVKNDTRSKGPQRDSSTNCGRAPKPGSTDNIRACFQRQSSADTTQQKEPSCHGQSSGPTEDSVSGQRARILPWPEYFLPKYPKAAPIAIDVDSPSTRAAKRFPRAARQEAIA